MRVAIVAFVFIGSHGQLSKKLPWLGYDWIKQSQIDWFQETSQALRKQREKDESHSRFHLGLPFQHILFPEYRESDLLIRGGHRWEPSEGPKFYSGFCGALIDGNVIAVGSVHDHVNDFCAIKPQQKQLGAQQDGTKPHRLGP